MNIVNINLTVEVELFGKEFLIILLFKVLALGCFFE